VGAPLIRGPKGYSFLILDKYRPLSVLIRGVDPSVCISTELVNYFFVMGHKLKCIREYVTIRWNIYIYM